MPIRVNLGKAFPVLYGLIVDLDKEVEKTMSSVGIEVGFAHLLRLRGSQINHCSFCVRLHAREALASGESSDRVNLLSVWRETGYYTDRERAALELLESITLLASENFPDAVYERAEIHLTKDQIAAVEWLSIVINTWNRIAVSSQYTVTP